eukprot:TRINITY_DN645_c0_g1_i5.p1 TRINITY_DN645_c0_g1~~TRINITY_DN645_c0_g1_i5.p1  ORF type:complete len:182 (-),score=30.51 TRINITY_DN645_c0_g1_i5:278-775(-)
MARLCALTFLILAVESSGSSTFLSSTPEPKASVAVGSTSPPTMAAAAQPFDETHVCPQFSSDCWSAVAECFKNTPLNGEGTVAAAEMSVTCKRIGESLSVYNMIPWWGWILIVVGVVAIILAVIFCIAKCGWRLVKSAFGTGTAPSSRSSRKTSEGSREAAESSA